ncbi:MAG: hypothetical protein CMD78_02775 [Gammaproteobacteria bacterium]|nr:hypothetical protein [Gammaproteobacteria bacterium]|tara:strand:+ start:18894 stop:19970 length:1077 start_codon:yes stop_codon:yes gene_type:complete
MTATLELARSIAESVRFTGELEFDRSGRNVASDVGGMRSIYSQHNLQISHAVTPSLARSLDEVYDRLCIPHTAVTAYVYPDPEIQATCFSTSNTDCLLSFSSGLVNLLDDSELQFVVGHEIGHFLLSHGVVDGKGDTSSLEYLMRQRAKEISADRIGFIACRSLENSVRAMMKSASGLPTQKLRFDTDAFLSQLEESEALTYSMSQSTTHPSMLVRCRAVLWFSLNGPIKESLDYAGKEQLQKIDARIEKDLQRYVDGPARDKIEQTKKNYAFWETVEQAIQDGCFDKHEQKVVSANFGLDKLKGLLGLIDGLNTADVIETVRTKKIQAREELEAILPNRFEEEVVLITESVNETLFR